MCLTSRVWVLSIPASELTELLQWMLQWHIILCIKQIMLEWENCLMARSHWLFTDYWSLEFIFNYFWQCYWCMYACLPFVHQLGRIFTWKRGFTPRKCKNWLWRQYLQTHHPHDYTFFTKGRNNLRSYWLDNFKEILNNL